MKNRITIAFQDSPENKLLYEAAAKNAGVGIGEWYRNALRVALVSGSSNGRTSDFDSDNHGSGPCPETTHICWYRRNKQSCPK